MCKVDKCPKFIIKNFPRHTNPTTLIKRLVKITFQVVYTVPEYTWIHTSENIPTWKHFSHLLQQLIFKTSHNLLYSGILKSKITNDLDYLQPTIFVPYYMPSTYKFKSIEMCVKLLKISEHPLVVNSHLLCVGCCVSWLLYAVCIYLMWCGYIMYELFLYFDVRYHR